MTHSWKSSFLFCRGNLTGAKRPFCSYIYLFLYKIFWWSFLSVTLVARANWFSQLCFPGFLPYWPIPFSEIFYTNHPQLLLLEFLFLIRREAKSRLPLGDSDSFCTAKVQIHHLNLHGKELTTYANFLHEVQPIFSIHKSVFKAVFVAVHRKKKSDTCVQIILAGEKWRSESILSFSAATVWRKSFKFKH